MKNQKKRETVTPRGESAGLGKTLGICALLLCIALLCLGLCRPADPAPGTGEAERAPAGESAAPAALTARVNEDRPRPLRAGEKTAAETPALSRLHAEREYKIAGEGREEELVSVKWYFYNDEEGTGWVENEEGQVVQTLTLDERGLVDSAVFLGEDGEELSWEEYQHDEAGSRSQVLHYEGGELTREYHYTYDQDKLLHEALILLYQGGEEISRSEIVPLDDRTLEMRTYRGGMMAVGRVERDYENGKPVEQRNYNPDGSLAYTIRWEEEPEALIHRTLTSYPDGSVQIVEREAEPIETPALFRYTYVGTGSTEGVEGEVELTKEQFYFYSDDGTGRVEDAEGRLLESLTLNEKGQIKESIVYDENGDFAKRVEYEYDRFGNQSRVRYYDADDNLLSEWEYRCNAFRVQEYRVNRQYEDGREVQRIEFEVLDRTHALNSIYYDGELSVSQRFLYIYDGADLVEQQRVNDDGTPGTSAFWIRDEDHNPLRYLMPAGPDRYSVILYEYEKIG